LVGPDVWFAHAVHVDGNGIKTFANNRWCCSLSDLEYAPGIWIAPVLEYIRAGVNVGLGVDGSASNDGSNLLEEVRQAMLVSRWSRTDWGLLGDDAPPLMTAGRH
jgi:cytosine/adenosine deaminase-related metal-dependent hydrolase